jgi:hypothetical protein
MPLGDGIRRNIATVTKEERDRLRDAILALGQKLFPPKTTDGVPGGVSYWFKQDEIHDSTHVHFCPAFLPWHRELMNRFEAMLREIDPALSLHYWDWTADPQNLTDSDGKPLNLFTPDFMGNAIGPGNTKIEIGPPWKSASVPGLFYGAAAGQDRDTTGNPFDPPLTVTRQVGVHASLITPLQEKTVLNAKDFVAFDNEMEGTGVNIHAQGHSYIGGDLLDPHTSFRDPFVFLMHSNIDRLFAMWQRQPGQQKRLDPAQLYKAQSTGFNGFENTKGGDRTTIDPPGVPVLPCDNDVSPPPGPPPTGCFGDHRPWWGILSPLEPWAGPGATAQSAATGIIKNVKSVRPWVPLPFENEQVFPIKDSRDPSVVIPPSYDTAPHSSYIVTNRDTFSNAEVTAKGSPAVFSSALYVIYDGFEPAELGVASTPLPATPPNLPTFTFTGASNILAVNPSASYEDPSGAIDMPQRITISYDLKFANANDFPATTGGELPVNIQASLNYKVDTGTGGTIVNLTETASAELLLVNQPNPYMVDTEQGDPSPYWLSVDTRVFQMRKSDPALAGVTQGDMDADPSAPFKFIQGVVSAFNSFNPANPSDPSHPFLQLSEDETASQLELSQKVSGQRVYNYAVAKVRYLAPSGVDATPVSVFFRVFSTAVSALDYDAAIGATGNYRRTSIPNAPAVPLLGIENDSQGQPETASIPFFASARVDTSTAKMTSQPPDATNIQTIMSCRGAGAVPPLPPCPLNTENVAYFGVWLDINLAPGDPNFRQFPLSPMGVSGWPDGPYSGALSSLQQLMLGTHHCMVAEIFFWPAGVVSDPIPHNASPASSDRLAQRNLALIKSGNPGYPATHTVQHTFIVKPSVNSVDQPARLGIAEAAAAAAVIAPRHRGPDELIIRWNNVPRTAEAAFYLPEIEVDEILSLSALRQHPTVLEKVDAHTLRCRLSDVTFIPLPTRKGTLAGLMSLTLPPGVRTGQVFRFSVEQYSGYTLKTLGAFQMTIPVRPDPEILPEEIRKLAVMRYVQQAIPATSRWYSIFVRYIDQIAARVRGFGGDPDAVKPSPDGGEGTPEPPVCHPHEPAEVCPPDLWSLNIPWQECDIEGEIELKLRFRRKCK